MVYRAVLVDDEQLALKRLLRLLRDQPDIEVVGMAENGRKALELIRQTTPDLLFLDIQMPGITGFEVVQRLDHPPIVIFTTAYDEYALQAFEANAVDYLLKPVERARLEKALEKLKQLRTRSDREDLSERLSAVLNKLERREEDNRLCFIPVKTGDRILVIDVKDVLYFYSSDKYTFLVTAEKEHIIDRTLADLEERLDPKHFVRIHRSTIVNVGQVKEIVSWFGGRYICRLKNCAKDLPVSRSMVKNLRDTFGF